MTVAELVTRTVPPTRQLRAFCVTFGVVLLVMTHSPAEVVALEESDRCASFLPANLRREIEKRFSSYRLPQASDNSPEDQRYSVEHGGSGCLGVATGDLDGNGTPDVALLLAPRDEGKRTFLVVARRSKSKGWRVDRLYEFDAPRGRLFVERLKAGRYKRSEVAEGPMESGEVVRFQSKRDGLLAGKIESAEVAFFFVKGHWVHVSVAE